MSQQEQHENRQLGGYKAWVYTPLLQLTLRALHNPNVSFTINLTDDRSVQKPKNTLLPYVPSLKSWLMSRSSKNMVYP